jgi:GNAT superfamily N-acetyltransferase
MLVRLAVPAEAEQISEVLLRAFEEFRPQYSRGLFDATAIPAHEVGERMAEGPVWVVESDGRLIGTVGAVLQGATCYMRGMAIVPEARGKSIGRRLLERVEQFALASGSKEIKLSTTPFLHPAIALYQRWGFERQAGSEYDFLGTIAFTMIKPLPDARTA